MIGPKIVWVLLELMAAGLFFYNGNGYALAFAAAFLLIPILSVPFNLFLRGKVQVAVDAPVSLEKGAEGCAEIILKNPSIFPVFRVRMRVKIINQLNMRTKKCKVITWLNFRDIKNHKFSVGDGYCGRLRISVDEVLLYDCFGLIGVRCKCTAEGYTTVQPDTFPIDIGLNPAFNTLEESDVYAQDKAGYDLTETYQIREYVPGDSPRQIHWKLSGKFDRLIVREPSLPIIHSVLVFWERSGIQDDLDLTDAQAEVLVSVCKSLLEQSILFTVGWNDTERELCILNEIRDMDDLVGVIPGALKAAGKKTGVGGAEMLISTASHALCAHMIYIAEKPQSGAQELHNFGETTMLLCGDSSYNEAIVFDCEHYKDQVQHLRI